MTMSIQSQAQKSAELFSALMSLNFETAKALGENFQKVSSQQLTKSVEVAQKAASVSSPEDFQSFCSEKLKEQQKVVDDLSKDSVTTVQKYTKSVQDIMGKYFDEAMKNGKSAAAAVQKV